MSVRPDQPSEVLVVFSDIVEWSKEDAVGQLRMIQDLNHKTKTALDALADGLKPTWSTGTGDGFALAFPSDAVAAIAALESMYQLYERVTAEAEYKIRMSACKGLVLQYTNDLLQGKADICGPAVNVARRLLDAASAGWFLVNDHFANSLTEWDRALWGKRFLPSRQYLAKHGLVVGARRLVGETESHGYTSLFVSHGAPDVLKAASNIGIIADNAVAETATKLSTSLIGIHRFLIYWMDASCKGISPDAVIVSPIWRPEQFNHTGMPDPSLLSPLAAELQATIRPIMLTEPVSTILESSNRPKVWAKDWRFPLSDRPTLLITVGGSDYRATKAIEHAFQQPVRYKDTMCTLREAFETKLLDLEDDWPSMIVSHISMLTTDDYLIFAQRGKRDRVDFASGCFSPSCEEQWDPSKEQTPHGTVLRCLSEEWYIDEKHGVTVPEGSIRLVAIGREWGKYWTTVLCYVVDLPCTAAKVLECWNLVPPDKAEAAAVGAVSIKEMSERMAILKMAQTREVRPAELMTRCKAMWAGHWSDNELHDTTGVARIVFSLTHRYGVEEAGFDKLTPNV